MRKNKSWFEDLFIGQQTFIVILFIGLACTSIYLFHRINVADKKILHLNFIALLLGLVFEYRRISKNWKTVIGTAVAAFMFSFLAFAKGKGQQVYNFEDHLEMWPYYFLGFYILIATFIEYKNVTVKINEGVTLLLTISINYWIIGNGYWDSNDILSLFLIISNAVLSVFSVYNSLTYASLSKQKILTLSIWSSMIVLLLAIDNFLKIYKYRDIEHLESISEGFFIFFQFFLLGISSMYIAQNISLLGAYFPGKEHIKTVRDINDVHLQRFSKDQFHVVDSVIIIFISVTAYGLNYFLHFLPTNFMIWTMVTITAPLLYLIHRIFG